MNKHSVEVVVVGGGLIGLLSAYLLREEGLSVVVLEKNQCGQESSWAGGGILSPLYPWRYDDAVNRLAYWSQQHYQAFTQQIHDISGIDPEWTRSGILLLDEDEFDTGERWASHYNTPSQRVDIALEEPQVSPKFKQGLLFGELAQVRNPRLLAALKLAAQQKGVQILEQTAVESFQSQDGDRLSSVYCAGGREILAQKIVVCGGAWSHQILQGLGTVLPIKPVQGQMLLFKGEPGLLSHIVMWQGRYVIPRRDGHILMGSTLEDVGFDKHTTASAKKSLLESADQFIPGLSRLPLVKHWAGLRPSSPDGIPFIGRHPRYSNLYINSGHFRNGVVLGLASAQLLSDLICRRQPIVDQIPYEISCD